jgi:crotonobetainyl-CoA:carnitine CoA-transferase CaiB-like acyl-CoA transferase
MPGPLTGYKILDLTSVVMGPYATQNLGDLGADVIKVESPDGDIMRHMGAAKRPAMGPIHWALNRNKRSLVLDLKKPAAREALLRLARNADVFVHSMRPDAIERLGLGYVALKAVRSDIVYCGAYGYGKSGPYALEPAYDDMIQGMCGVAALNEQLAGEPRFTPTIIGDKVSGLFITYSVMAALLHRARTGEGQSIEVPMFESMVSFLLAEHMWERTFDREHGAVGYPRVMSQLRKPHRTTDGYVCVLPYTDRNWKDFFQLAERPDLAADPRYFSATSRSSNYEPLYAELGKIVAGNSNAYWLVECSKLSIPVAPVNRLEDLFTDPHLSAVEMFADYEHPDFGNVTQIKFPVTFSQGPNEVRRLAPMLGEHSEEILSESGFSKDEISQLRASGAAI